MSKNYKFHNPDGLYFISFAVVGWLDVFTRREYKDILVDSLRHCQEKKGLQLFAWVIMTNHVHLIAKADGSNTMPEILRDFKKYTSRQLVKAIEENPKESRKENFLTNFKNEGLNNSNNKEFQFWRQDNRPIELWSNAVIEQKMDYLHNNPVVAGFVEEPEEYLYSSAKYLAQGRGLLEVDPL